MSEPLSQRVDDVKCLLIYLPNIHKPTSFFVFVLKPNLDVQDVHDFALRCYILKLYTQPRSKTASQLLLDVLETLVEKNLESPRCVLYAEAPVVANCHFQWNFTLLSNIYYKCCFYGSTNENFHHTVQTLDCHFCFHATSPQSGANTEVWFSTAIGCLSWEWQWDHNFWC